MPQYTDTIKQEIMKDQITLEELAPFLPYGLDIYCPKALSSYEMHPIGGTAYIGISEVIRSPTLYKPIVRPMSDVHNNDLMWKEIASEHARSNNDDYLIQRDFNTKSCLSYDFKIWLIKNHFDVFGWIERGLAIDINTLNHETQTSN